MRQCGDCQLCCKLLPMSAGVRFAPATVEMAIGAGLISLGDATGTVADFDKPAGDRCPHQRHHKGCSIYARRPFGCRFWNCRWLVADDTADLARPDRSHYVVDISPDYVTQSDGAGKTRTVPVIQIWCDPDYPDAHRDPELRAYLERRAAEGYAALVRYNAIDAMFVAAPALTDDGQWQERRPRGVDAHPHTAADKVRALGTMKLELGTMKLEVRERVDR